MQRVSVRDARKNIGRLLDAVVAGEEIVITRRNKPVAKLVGLFPGQTPEIAFPSRRELRAAIPACRTTASELVREMRDERG